MIGHPAFTYRTDINPPPWTDDDYFFRALVCLLKGEGSRIQRPARMHRGQWWELGAGDTDKAFHYASASIARMLEDIYPFSPQKTPYLSLALVPLPSKDVTTSASPRPMFNTLRIARDVAEKCGTPCEVKDCVTWTKRLRKSHNTPGARHPNTMYPYIRIDADQLGGHDIWVLIDDVVTSGASIQAVNRAMLDHGIGFERAVVVARSLKGPDLPDDRMYPPPFEIEDYHPSPHLRRQAGIENWEEF